MFSDAIPQNVPPLLAPIFEFVAATRSEGINTLGNRADKWFACTLLEPLPIGRYIHIGATATPHTQTGVGS